jgi:trimeric autotransporter adhesin
VRRDPLLRDPITLAVAGDGSLVVGQLREGPLVRLAGGRATTLADGLGVFHVYVAGGATYVAARDGAVYRVDGSSFTRVSPAMDASAVAVDAAGNLYVTLYVGWIKKVALDGTITTIAGDGTEGYAGDGGPATEARIFHPHSVALGADGALYLADTENRRIRRIDLATGRITTFGGDVGLTVSVAAAPDGSIYSADVVRDGAGGGVTRTTPDGVTRRILSLRTANGVAVAPGGTVYVNAWEDKRVLRLDPGTGRTTTVARG